VFFSAEFSAPWGFSASEPEKMAGTLGLGAAAQLGLYHLVIDGGAVVDLKDGSSIQLQPGDVVIFPHGHAHHMSSGAGVTRPFPNYGIETKIKARDLSPSHAGGCGEVSRFVCGYMTCDPNLCRPILSKALPSQQFRNAWRARTRSFPASTGPTRRPRYLLPMATQRGPTPTTSRPF
jgi:hypothetical protein